MWTVVGPRLKSEPDITKLHPNCIATPELEVEAEYDPILEPELELSLEDPAPLDASATDNAPSLVSLNPSSRKENENYSLNTAP